MAREPAPVVMGQNAGKQGEGNPPLQLPRIHCLPDHLASQIAAGEVVERPLSVVKELVENALDAIASEITIELIGSGSGLIRVRDNGQGIHPEDLVLSVHRHATSKLSAVEDLEYIASLGFRGEALSSIASVSRLRLASRAQGAEQAWCLESGQQEPVPIAHPVGTTVDVRDLFYNTPARSKFLKSPRTEWLHVQQLVRAMALSRCGTGFKLLHECRQVYHFPPRPEAPEERIKDVLGARFLRAAFAVDGRHNGMRLRGWMSHPEQARSQNDLQFFHVNGRLVRERLLVHAIRQACDARLPSGRYAAYLLYLDIDPALVDVNVHPTKREVRFRHQGAVHDLLFSAVSTSLKSASTLSGLSCPPVPPVGNEPPMTFKPTSEGCRETSLEPSQAPSGLVQHSGLPYRITRQGKTAWLGEDRPRWWILPDSRFVLMVRSATVCLFDVAAARECLSRYELERQWQSADVPIRRLHLPLCLEVSSTEARVLESCQQLLAEHGLQLHLTSPAQVALDAFPECLAGADLAALTREVLQWLAQGQDLREVSNRPELSRLLAGHVNDALPECPSEMELQSLVTLWERHGGNIQGAVPWRILKESDWCALIQSR